MMPLLTKSITLVAVLDKINEVHNLVLVVDDDPISILVCETILRKNKFAEEIRTFNSAVAAHDFLKSHYEEGNPLPAFIFLDVLMPGMDGWKFLSVYEEMLNFEDVSPHVVMLSATFDPEDKARAEAHPLVLQFLSKPIKRDNLEELNSRN
jgi:CheY-like chemotaxis protein